MSPRLTTGRPPWKLPASIASVSATIDGQRLVVDLDGGGAESRGLEGLPQHPADGVPDEHHLVGEERLVVLDPGVVDAGDVARR